MPALAFTIGGVTYDNVEEDSVSIESILGQTIDTARLVLFDKDRSLNIPEGVDIVITRSDTGARVFGGLTSTIKGSIEGGIQRKWQVDCQDYTALLQSIYFFASYVNGFTFDGLSGDKAIIANLFEKTVIGASGATGAASEIEARTYVQQALSSMGGPLLFNYVSALEAMRTICQATGYNYYVDQNLKLHYYFRESNAAPFGLSDSPDGSATLMYRKPIWTRDATSLINNYVVFGPQNITSPQAYILPSDGVRTVVALLPSSTSVPALPNYPLVAPPGQTVITVEVNTGSDVSPVWTARTVGISAIDTIPPKQVLHDSIGRNLTFATAPPNLTNAIRVTGSYLLQTGAAGSLAQSITKYGRIFTRRFVASDSVSVAGLTQKLANYKTEYGNALDVVTLSIDDDVFPGTARFETGQMVPFRNDILGINKSFLIHRITTKILGGPNLTYDLELRDWFTDNLA